MRLGRILLLLSFVFSAQVAIAQTEDADAFYKTVTGSVASWYRTTYWLMPAVVTFGEDTTDRVVLIASNKAVHQRLYREMNADAYSRMMYEKLMNKETLIVTRSQYQDLLSTGAVFPIKEKECSEYAGTKLRQMLKKYFYGAYPSYAKIEFSLKNDECRCLVKNMYDRHIYIADDIAVGSFIYSEKYSVKAD